MNWRERFMARGESYLSRLVLGCSQAQQERAQPPMPTAKVLPFRPRGAPSPSLLAAITAPDGDDAA